CWSCRQRASSEVRRSRTHSNRWVTGGFREVYRCGNRQVGESGELRRHQTGIIGLRHQRAAHFRAASNSRRNVRKAEAMSLPETRETLEQGIDLRFGLRNALLPLVEWERIQGYLREGSARRTSSPVEYRKRGTLVPVPWRSPASAG